jgi:hypothetical protein
MYFFLWETQASQNTHAKGRWLNDLALRLQAQKYNSKITSHLRTQIEDLFITMMTNHLTLENTRPYAYIYRR